MRHSSRPFPVLLAVSLIALGAPMAAAQGGRPANPCQSVSNNDRPTHCDVREQTIAAPSVLVVDATPNGGIAVHGWNRPEVNVQAKVTAYADSEAEARSLAGQVEVVVEGGRVSARGPRNTGDSGWSVSFDVMVPSQGSLDLRSTNGGIKIEEVSGQLSFRTTNGGVTLRNVNGDVRGGTTNGGLRVELDGAGWVGEGLDVETQNGGVRLIVPEGYSAHLEARVQNGGLNVDFPVTVQGDYRRILSTDLGAGGAPIKVRTVNGGVTISRK